jgi:hypothetical protein
MKTFLIILLLVGCTKLRPAKTEDTFTIEPQSTALEQADRFLQPNVFSERVLLTHIGNIRIDPNGKTYTTPPIELSIPEERLARSTPSGPQVLFKIGCNSLFFFAFVDKKDLLRTTNQRVELQIAPDDQLKHASLHLAPGAPITVSECQGLACRIQFNQNGYLSYEDYYNPLDQHIAAWGWVDESAVGYIYQPENFVVNESSNCFSIEKGAKLYDGPKGDPFLEFTEDKIWRIDKSGDNTVILQRNRISGTGTFRTGQVNNSECYPRGSRGGGCGWGISDTKLIRQKKGTPIFDQPHGKVVGVVAKDEKFILNQELDGWKEISVPTQWEGLSFWVSGEYDEK